MILLPVSFAGIKLDGTTGIYGLQFQIPHPRPLIKVMQVAGGRLVDFDYSQDAELQPQPFTISLLFDGTTNTGVSDLYDTLLAPPTDGKLGKTGTFVAKRHGNVAIYQCTARLAAVTHSLNEGDYYPTAGQVTDAVVTFVPSTNWVASV